MKNQTVKSRFGNFKWSLVLQIFFLLLVAVSCTDKEKEKNQRLLNDLKQYVREHRDSVQLYVSGSADELDKEFDAKKAELELRLDRMDDSMKISYNHVVNDWQAFKDEVAAKVEENKRELEIERVKNSLTISGVKNDYSNLEAPSALEQYKHFVSTVETNKETYTKEQWVIVSASWSKLNDRRKEIAKGISTSDELKIKKLQIEYTAVKALNKPTAENM